MASRKLPHSHSVSKIIHSERGAVRRDFAELFTVALLAFAIGLAIGALLCNMADD